MNNLFYPECIRGDHRIEYQYELRVGNILSRSCITEINQRHVAESMIGS
jgi:hypothetical protein